MGSQKFQNIYMHIFLCFKSRILLADDSRHGQKLLTFIDDINKSKFCSKIIDKPVLIISKMKVRFTL